MSKPIKSSEITPETLYLSRRRFIKNTLTMAAASLYLSACGDQKPAGPTAVPTASLPLPSAGGECG